MIVWTFEGIFMAVILSIIASAAVLMSALHVYGCVMEYFEYIDKRRQFRRHVKRVKDIADHYKMYQCFSPYVDELATRKNEIQHLINWARTSKRKKGKISLADDWQKQAIAAEQGK